MSTAPSIQRWRVAVRRLGWPGWAGLVLCALAAWSHHVWVPEQADAAAQTASQARQLRHALRERAEAQVAAARETPDRGAAGRIDPHAGQQVLWALLWQGLPDADAQPQAGWRLQQHVLSTAHQAGVPLGTVQWRGEWAPWVDPAHPQGLWRQRMTLTLQLPYPVLRAWLSLLLQAPAVTLDAIDVQRSWGRRQARRQP